MANTKISDLTAVTSLAETDELVVARSGASNKLAGQHFPGKVLDYAQITSDVSITATASDSGTAVVSLPSRAYDGSTTVMLEFFCPRFEPGTTANSELIAEIEDGTTLVLARFVEVRSVGSGVSGFGSVFASYRITPSAASHTYNVKAWRVTSDGVVRAGTTNRAPTWMRAIVC